MSVVKRIIKDSIERVKVDELLAKEYEQAGYGGIQLTKTPLGAQINLFAMRPGRVIGKRGRAIKEASAKLEEQLGLPNPQITVIEVEVPELNPLIMASRVANALERGVHFRRSVFWSLNRIMESGALGCEIILKGPLRSARSRFEKVVEGYVPKSGDPALKHVKKATIHVKMKRGILGVTVHIVAPDAKFPDKVDLSNLPEIEYQLPIEPEVVETVEEPASLAEPETPETTEEVVEETIVVEEPKVEVETPEKVVKAEAEEVLETPEVVETVEESVSLTEPATAEPTEEVIEEPVVVEEPKVEVETPEPETKVKAEAEEVLETPEAVEETPVEKPEPETEEPVETPESDLVPTETEEEAEPKVVEAEPEPEPLPEVEEKVEAEKKPEPEEEEK
jgi:small subunit ribosomal protein S3